MRIFHIDLTRLVAEQLPTAMRKPLMHQLASVLVRPLNTLHASLTDLRRRSVYRATRNGQVCYIQAALNDEFDITERRIRVIDASSTDWIVLRRQPDIVEERQWVMAQRGRPILVPRQNGVGAVGFDFAVITNGVAHDRNRLIDLVNYYKLASKRYTIIEH